MKSVYLASMLASGVLILGGLGLAATAYWKIGIVCVLLGLGYLYFNYRAWSRLKNNPK